MLIRRYKEGFALKMAQPVRIASGLVIALIIIVLIKTRNELVFYQPLAPPL